MEFLARPIVRRAAFARASQPLFPACLPRALRRPFQGFFRVELRKDLFRGPVNGGREHLVRRSCWLLHGYALRRSYDRPGILCGRVRQVAAVFGVCIYGCSFIPPTRLRPAVAPEFLAANVAFPGDRSVFICFSLSVYVPVVLQFRTSASSRGESCSRLYIWFLRSFEGGGSFVCLLAKWMLPTKETF